VEREEEGKKRKEMINQEKEEEEEEGHMRRRIGQGRAGQDVSLSLSDRATSRHSSLCPSVLCGNS
jgi:hypothetical protein